MGRKIQHVVGPGVDGKPVPAIDHLPVGLEAGEPLIPVLSGDAVDRLPVGLHNLQLLIVHPDLSFKITLFPPDHLGNDLKDVGVDLVNQLLAQVGQAVLADVGGGEDKGKDILYVVEVLLSELDAAQGALGSPQDLLDPPAAIVEQDVRQRVVALARLSPLEGQHFDAHALPVGIVLPGLSKFRFLGRELPDNFLHGNRRHFLAEVGGHCDCPQAGAARRYPYQR